MSNVLALGPIVPDRDRGSRRKNPLRYPPNGAWPALMRADMAAAYVDERSVRTFLAKIGKIYPHPAIGTGARGVWRRSDLDAAHRRMSMSEQELIELL